MSAAGTARARTLTEALRRLNRDELVDLLQARPDLCYPAPADPVELAARATTATSVGRALESLNAFQRVVAEAIAALPAPVGIAEVAALLGPAGEQAAVEAAVAELRRQALLWGEDEQIQLVRAVREAYEPYPGGLAPPSPRPLEPAEIAARLAECDPEVQPLLDRLAWSPAGAVRHADRVVDARHARTPVEQLLARRLLRPLDPDTVILPREVALHVRQGRFTPEAPASRPPPVDGVPLEPARADRAAAGSAFGLLHDLELAAHALETQPHRLLRAGGLSTRDVAALARTLNSDPAHAGFVLECAAAAGLVAPGSNLCLLPTTAFDRWLSHDPAVRWRMIADAWLVLPRFPSRSSEPGAHVLGPEADARVAADLRGHVLRLALASGPGRALELDQLTAALIWHRPGTARAAGADPATVVDWIWREAGWLGLTGLGALSGFAAALLRPAEPLPPDLAALFPTPVEEIIVQADLTAVAPGPLPQRIARELRLMADLESHGGAAVYRFAPASLRRAFDSGWSAAEIHAWLEQHSATGVPQPLRYLVDDVARQFGTIRVGTAGSYLTTDDPAQAAALLAHPDAAFLGLRELAPGVLVAGADTYEVVALLRSLGRTPAVEDERGETVSPPPALRAPAALTRSAPRPPTATEVADLMIRPRPARSGADPVAAVVARLRSAVTDGSRVQIVYADAEGRPQSVDLAPLDVEAGVVRGVDHASRRVLALPVARISRVSGSGRPAHPSGVGPAG